MLVVEDIIDSGLTLSYLMRNLESREPASLEVCALMTEACSAPDRRSGALYRLRDPDRFVVGYGLDFAERYRNLPYVAVLSDELASATALDSVTREGESHARWYPLPIEGP